MLSNPESFRLQPTKPCALNLMGTLHKCLIRNYRKIVTAIINASSSYSCHTVATRRGEYVRQLSWPLMRWRAERLTPVSIVSSDCDGVPG